MQRARGWHAACGAQVDEGAAARRSSPLRAPPTPADGGDGGGVRAENGPHNTPPRLWRKAAPVDDGSDDEGALMPSPPPPPFPPPPPHLHQRSHAPQPQPPASFFVAIDEFGSGCDASSRHRLGVGVAALVRALNNAHADATAEPSCRTAAKQPRNNRPPQALVRLVAASVHESACAALQPDWRADAGRCGDLVRRMWKLRMWKLRRHVQSLTRISPPRLVNSRRSASPGRCRRPRRHPRRTAGRTTRLLRRCSRRCGCVSPRARCRRSAWWRCGAWEVLS